VGRAPVLSDAIVQAGRAVSGQRPVDVMERLVAENRARRC
jgi:hypothetical protein